MTRLNPGKGHVGTLCMGALYLRSGRSGEGPPASPPGSTNFCNSSLLPSIQFSMREPFFPRRQAYCSQKTYNSPVLLGPSLSIPPGVFLPVARCNVISAPDLNIDVDHVKCRGKQQLIRIYILFAIRYS